MRRHQRRLAGFTRQTSPDFDHAAQGGFIQLVIGIERQCTDLLEMFGHHITGKRGGQTGTNRIEIEGLLTNQEGAHNHLPIVRHFERYHRRTRNPVTLHQARFNFTRFNTEAPQLELPVGSPKKHDGSVRQPPPPVTSPVGTNVVRMVLKGCRRFFRPVVVTVRHRHTADPDLTRNPDRRRATPGIPDLQRRAGNGPADRDRVITHPVIDRHPVPGNLDTGFGRAIEIVDHHPPVGGIGIEPRHQR